ncbi:MAG TPA: phosphatidylglycerol lysyltransferase domain-containing protein [bacterium]|nr:phosphatidylglycerol lysyltransferase domain-containing protein [bacterium]
MPVIRLPHADFFDSVESLDVCLEKASSLFYPAPVLSASLPAFLMWQDEFAYALVTKGTASFVVALYNKYVYFPVPPKPFNTDTLKSAFGYMGKVNGSGTGVSRIEGLTEEQKNQAETWGYPTRPTLVEYLYDRSQVGGLHGDPYRAKRAEINHLLKEHPVVLRPYRQSDLKACGDLFELWKNQRLPGLKGEMGEKMLLSSQKAHFRALHQGEDWGMDAWVTVLENRLAAYSVGASLSPDTYGIYLEVTDLTVKGLSAYIFANICRQVEPYSYINAGDAEGLPRLAESKEHWHPLQRLQLYAVDPQA